MGNPVSVRTVWDCCAFCGTRSMALHGVRGATPEEAMDRLLERAGGCSASSPGRSGASRRGRLGATPPR